MCSRGLTIALLGFSGCNQFYGLEPTTAVDATVVPDADPDRDDDGVANEVDDCPDTNDPDQHDEDGDGLGDACDPCALDPGPMLDADADGIGDACDPHPAEAVDCLRLFDSFRVYSDADWLRVPESQITPGVDALRLQIAMGSRTGIGPAGISGPSAFRVRFEAVTIGSELRLLDRSEPGNTDDGHYCSISKNTVTLENVVPGAPPITSFAPDLVPGTPMIATIVHDVASTPARFSCQPMPGLSAPMTATIFVGVQGTLPMIVGIGAGTDLTLTAVAFYGPRTNGNCDAATVR